MNTKGIRMSYNTIITEKAQPCLNVEKLYPYVLTTNKILI
jgi:hypothetical protein